MKIFRNRKILLAISVVLALLICFVLAPAINANASKQVNIVRVTKSISKGNKITKDMIQSVNVGGYNLPDNTEKSADDVIGKFALADFQPGDNILSTKVSDQAPDAYLSNLDGKRQAISFTIKNFADGLSGKLKSGDIISIYVAAYGDMKSTLHPDELQYIELVAATNDSGIDSTGNTQKESDKNSSNDMPSTLTVYATPQQAIKIADYEKNGTIHVALAYRGNQVTAEKFLALEEQYLAKQGDGSNEK